MSRDRSERILEEIRQSFGERRERFGRKPFGGYPLSFKRRATAAVARGIAPGLVAKAAGISEPSVRNWCKELKVKIEAPTELRLNDDVSEPPIVRESAVIHFPSGLRIEVPVAALTLEFIEHLNGVAL